MPVADSRVLPNLTYPGTVLHEQVPWGSIADTGTKTVVPRLSLAPTFRYDMAVNM